MQQKILPPNWSWVTLGDVCIKITDGAHRTPKYTTSGIPFISVKDIKNEKIYFDKCKYISEEEHKELIKRCNPEQGDLLLTKSGTIGRLAVVKTETQFSLFVSVALLKPNNLLVESEFLLLAVKNYINNIDVSQEIKGGLLKNFHIEDIKLTKIPLPPLAEQHHIVEKIEELFSELDNGIENLKTAKEQIKTYRQAVLKSAFEGKLVQGKSKKEKDKSGNGELPEGWEIVTVKDITHKIIGGGTPSTKNMTFWNGEIDWITSADIYGLKKIVPRKKINKEAIKNSATNLLPKGNIVVVTRVGLGKLAITDRDLCFSQDSQGLIINKGRVNILYALWYLSSAVQIFKFRNRGTTIKGVTKKQLSDLEFILPPMKEQTQIVEEIEKRFSVVDKMETLIDESLKKAEALRQSILKQAFEGSLV